MAMEPTVLGVALILIIGIRNCAQIQNNTAQRTGNNSFENFNEMMDKILTKREGSHTLTPAKASITQKKQDQEPTAGKPDQLELRRETARRGVQKNDKNKLNLTEHNLNENDSRRIYLKNVLHLNKSSGPVKDKNVDSENKKPFSVDKPNNNDIADHLSDDTNPKPAFNDNGNMDEPQYNSVPLEDDIMLPWLNLPSRRSFSGNNPSPHIDLTDHGLGVVLKEEIVFEIEDDKPPESPNQQVKNALHTSTPKPVLPYNPKMNGKYVNISYIPFSSSSQGSPNVPGRKINKIRYTVKPQKSSSTNGSSPKVQTSTGMPHTTNKLRKFIQMPQQIPLHIESNLKLQDEFKKLNKKIYTLEEFLNKTITKTNETKSHNVQTPRRRDKETQTESHNLLILYQKGDIENETEYRNLQIPHEIRDKEIKTEFNNSQITNKSREKEDEVDYRKLQIPHKRRDKENKTESHTLKIPHKMRVKENETEYRNSQVPHKRRDKENETVTSHLQISHERRDKEIGQPRLEQHFAELNFLRAGGPAINHPASEKTIQIRRIFCSITNPDQCFVSHGTMRQGIVENVIPRKNIADVSLLWRQAPFLESKALQRRMLVVELANIAKLNRDMQLIRKMRKGSKYVLPVSVYRKRLIVKPLGRIRQYNKLLS